MKKITLMISAMILVAINLICQDIWTQLNLPNSEMQVLSLTTDNNNRLFIGSDDNIYFTDNNGDTWASGTNWPGYPVKCMAVNSQNILFGGSFNDGIYRSADGGETYTSINEGITSLNIWCIYIEENDDLIIGTPGGMFKSTNNGDSWSQIGNNVVDVQAITRDQSGNYYAGTMYEGVYKSTDDGVTWEQVNNGLPVAAQNQITAIFSDPQDGILVAFYPNGVYRTTDQGANWLEFNDGLPFEASKMLEKGYSVDGMILVLGFLLILIIYSIGAYVMDFNNPVLFWMLIAGGLPMEPTTSSITANNNDQVYVGTYDEGLYTRSNFLSIEEIGGNTKHFSVSEAYPNPAKTTTSVEVSVKESCTISASISGINGQKGLGMLPQKVSAGTYKISLDIEQLPPGSYFIRIVAGENEKTVKVLKQ